MAEEVLLIRNSRIPHMLRVPACAVWRFGNIESCELTLANEGGGLDTSDKPKNGGQFGSSQLFKLVVTVDSKQFDSGGLTYFYLCYSEPFSGLAYSASGEPL